MWSVRSACDCGLCGVHVESVERGGEHAVDVDSVGWLWTGEAWNDFLWVNCSLPSLDKVKFASLCAACLY